MKLIWADSAIKDRLVIYEYIELDNSVAAGELDEMFNMTANRLIDNPQLGKPGRIIGTRELVVHKNYLLVYEVLDEHVIVLAVVHARRQWPVL